MKKFWKGFKDRMLTNMSKEELEALGALAADLVLALPLVAVIMGLIVCILLGALAMLRG